MDEMEFLKSLSDTEIKESEIQKLFEKNLKNYEEGLEYISSFLGTGVGVIDTLAIDDDNRPVIIEYKRPGNSERDALIQALHYFYWCSTHFEWVVRVVKTYKSDLFKSADLPINDIRIMIVAGDFDDHAKGAAYSVEPDTQLVEYDIALSGVKKVIIFKVIVDSSKADRVVHPPKREEDHFKDKETLKPIYEELKAKILTLGPDVKIGTPTQDYLPFLRNVIFCSIHVKKKWLRLDLRNIKGVENVKITPYPTGTWGYVHVDKKSDIDEIMPIIKVAYESGN